MIMYQAVLFAPDGAHVTDFSERKTKEDVWSMIEDMGSRWIFYPLCCVGTDKTIVDVGWGMPDSWKGKRISTVKKLLSETDQQQLCDAINNGFPIKILF